MLVCSPTDKPTDNHTIPQTTEFISFTIPVNTISDPDAGSSSFSCSFNVNGVRRPDDGLCSLHRTIVKASRRKLADCPILIAFDLPADDENSVAGTWTIDVEIGLPAIETLFGIHPLERVLKGEIRAG
ncbi:hypothetical protein KFU94_40630 [Chloroflexi bacterium TSY]|nr:hypothetical protein [Chloroflexi bacterium TSY]